MLRILHTADWHLGQSFHGYDRDYEHTRFLDWLLRVLSDRRIDVLLIAGDIFDSVNPSAAAQRLYFNFLARAHEALPKLQIIVTAGNHDAGARLEAPAGLLECLNITVVGTVTREPAGSIQLQRFLVPLKNSSGTVEAIAIAVPFLRPADVPLLAEASDFYLDGIRGLYAQAVEAAQVLRDLECPNVPLIALGHCHLQDAAESDSERRLIVGGGEALGLDVFPPTLAYVALGHLHKPQELDGGRIRYCGSPIPLSFSEKDYEHRVVEVLLEASGNLTASSVPVPRSAALLRLPIELAAPIEEILQLLDATEFDSQLPSEAYPFLEVRVLDNGPDPTRRRRIELALEGKPVRLASIKLEMPQWSVIAGKPNSVTLPALADLATLDPLEIMCAAHRERYACEPEAGIIAALREILSEEAHSPSSHS